MAMPIPPDTPGDISVFYEEGKFLFRVDDSRSIYVYDRDAADKPTCAGECARNWRPVLASKNSKPVGGWTLVKRADGSLQWCYRHRPVYTFGHDRPGDSKGDGVDGVWHLVEP